ncbi:hypothetical protein DPSP01_010902 [Paraphaeosphaeria sporulosa]|uniref:FAD-binding domain-containing protein n=1 Tax=Paraphaeosphaeria sporulosa TaxID=1460663 RepID=A0A177CBA0_9PLEO|nr:FAD-binding domain-containing protein [Paraphaeosphaeria sporulosa]OAG04129.1 FAD-binding domain-containing protein [Paraphaeosphaeria sporulosa]
MYTALLLGLLPLASATIKGKEGNCAAEHIKFANPSHVCNTLKAQFANLTFLPEDQGYEKETKVSWDASSWTNPACVFVPRNADDLSYAVKAMVKTSTLFAMRGGGHMPISDAANINSTGVQISSTNLNILALSEDKQTMSIGPAFRWGDVFEFMDGSNLTVVGGRLPPVGVPGLLLGGGISYFSYAHGLASSNGKIKAYEVVLANGTVATITADGDHADLYWALQGGGNSFALVTRFDLQTFPLQQTLRAEATYEESEETKDVYLDALLDYTLHGDVDPAFAITPVARWGPNFTVPSYEATLLFNGSVAPSHGPATKFFNGSIKSVNDSSTLKPQSLAEYSRLTKFAFEEGGPGYGFRQRFRVVPAKATREAMDIIHDNWFDLLKERDLANRITGFFCGLAYNAVTRTMARMSEGSPQNVDQEPAFWVEESISWSNAEDDPQITKFLEDVNAKIEAQLKEKDLMARYIYLNDANKGQGVFESYGNENVRKLQAIRDRYDPNRIYTDLMPGGFKVAHAKAK